MICFFKSKSQSTPAFDGICVFILCSAYSLYVAPTLWMPRPQYLMCPMGGGEGGGDLFCLALSRERWVLPIWQVRDDQFVSWKSKMSHDLRQHRFVYPPRLGLKPRRIDSFENRQRFISSHFSLYP